MVNVVVRTPTNLIALFLTASEGEYIVPIHLVMSTSAEPIIYRERVQVRCEVSLNKKIKTPAKNSILNEERTFLVDLH